MAGFYSDTQEKCLLLGDVVTGFRAVVPQLHKPGTKGGVLGISVTEPEYFAVTTPCCSVGSQQISLAPLVHVRPAWISNPYLADDLTRINTPGPAENFMPPSAKQRLNDEELQKLLNRDSIFGFVECFVYAQHDLLQTYELKGTVGAPKKSGYWLLEFGSAFRVECDQISRKAAPDGVKLLELSIETRQQLRAKLVNYFGRVPDEDLATAGTR